MSAHSPIHGNQRRQSSLSDRPPRGVLEAPEGAPSDLDWVTGLSSEGRSGLMLSSSSKMRVSSADEAGARSPPRGGMKSCHFEPTGACRLPSAGDHPDLKARLPCLAERRTRCINHQPRQLQTTVFV
jgi:hypothetical protein